MSREGCGKLSPAVVGDLASVDQAELDTPAQRAALDRRVLGLAIPAIGENLLQTALLMVDTVMIARFDPLNPALLAASSVAGSILWRAHMTFACIEKGTTALVARHIGEGDRDRAARVVAQSIYLATAIGVLIMVVGVLFAGQIMTWMEAPAEVVKVGTPFLQVIFLASIARMFFFVASASLRGAGDTRSPMYITLWMNGINILFNWLLIYGALGFPRLGLTGSGIATALSITFSAVAVGWVMLRGRSAFHLHWHHFRPDFSIMRSIFRIAWPALIEEVLISIGFLYFIAAIAHLGTEVLAAHTVAARVESLSFMAGFGFAVAASTLVGQSLGAKSLPLARLSFRRTTHYCVAMMTMIAVGLIIWGEQLVALFGPRNETVLSVGGILLMIAALEQPLLAICMTLSGGMRGAGDTLSPMIVSVIGNLGVRLGIVWLTGLFGWGIVGIYLATVVDWMIRAMLLFAFYRRGRWTRLKV